MEPSFESDARLLEAGDREAGTACAHCTVVLQRGERVAQCTRCGTVQHRDCWITRGGCGSYQCAPANRAAQAAAFGQHVPPVGAGAWTISADELDRAVPLPPPRPPFSPPDPNLVFSTATTPG